MISLIFFYFSQSPKQECSRIIPQETKQGDLTPHQLTPSTKLKRIVIKTEHVIPADFEAKSQLKEAIKVL